VCWEDVVRTAWLFVAGLLVATDARSQTLLHDVTESGAPPAAIQSSSAVAKVPVFRSGVDLVALNIVVTDGGARFVTGLQSGNFAVYEDGVQQDVSYFAATSVPLDLAILLDTSSSMSDKLQEVQQAAAGFVSTLHNGDRTMIVDIKDATKVLQPLTGDIGAAKAAITATTAKGGTALFNGLYLTLKELTKQRRLNDDVRRQAMVVLTDGEDTASLVSFDDVMAQAKEAGIAIYTITLRSPYLVQTATASGRRYFSEAEYGMKSLALETGARAFFPAAISELSGVYGSIAEELASQYALGYVPKNPRRDGTFRKLTIRIEDHPGAAPRTRSGYVAPRSDQKAGTH
jgi:Ca-activated chloride channel homolog